MGAISVGTSSWADPGFVEEWYPPGLPARERLPWYAQHFDAVEVNSTFYALPAPRTVARWAQCTGEGFTFDVKLHRLLSRHAAPPSSLPKDLRDDVAVTGKRPRVVLDAELEREMARRTLDAFEPLITAGRLTSLLLQLTPAFKPGAHQLAELEDLVDALTPLRLAIELRHPGWLDPGRVEATLAWFEHAGAAFVCVDAPQVKAPTALPPIDVVTRADLAYLRAHGRNAEGYTRGRSVAERFGYRYSDDELREIGQRARELAAEAAEVRLMFNNNRGSDAPVAAERMRELLDV
ncbi:DUF72 domain-containing protein [Capillimicrobium parvum]|uniref:DUF72 domain-containing protein n=1 Tax=Capillimicrobium parvum TaxID=2884022 RepID=A0A9E6XWD5_9ACTN|nr:DUF72 domain-containing protein [Capillimicrobium parvum]UGS35687.1 hypothetical protein DSM104329_02082 [Capillimicrobium parvum]